MNETIKAFDEILDAYTIEKTGPKTYKMSGRLARGDAVWKFDAAGRTMEGCCAEGLAKLKAELAALAELAKRIA